MHIAFVLINAELGKEREILKELRGMSEIKEAHIVFGVYDIIAKVETAGADALKETVASKIRRIREIRNTLTMTVAEGI